MFKFFLKIVPKETYCSLVYFHAEPIAYRQTACLLESHAWQEREFL